MPMQKAMLNRQHSAARQRPAMAPPPIQTVGHSPRVNAMGETMNSPVVQPTPPSQRSSPSTTRSPGFPMQGLASPATELQPRQQYPQQRQMQPMPQSAFQQQQQRAHNRSMSAHTMGQPYPRRSMHVPVSQTQAAYYPTSFQKHYDQLGKSTPIQPFPFLLGSFVRPRLNPLVQTRSMTLKLTCLTTSMATMWIQIASFPISGCHPKPEAVLGWGCRRLHQRLLLRQAMQGDIYPLFPSIMILCLMQIRSGFQHRCISRILLVDYSRREGNVTLSIIFHKVERSVIHMSICCTFTKVDDQISRGVVARFYSRSGERAGPSETWRTVMKALSYCLLRLITDGLRIANIPEAIVLMLDLRPSAIKRHLVLVAITCRAVSACVCDTAHVIN